MTSMLSVYSPLQHEPTSSYPFYTEMRPASSTSSHRDYYDSQNNHSSSATRGDQGAHTHEPGLPQQLSDTKSAPNSTSSTASSTSSISTAATELSQADNSASLNKSSATDDSAQPVTLTQPSSDNMVPSQNNQPSTQETNQATVSGNSQTQMYMSPSMYPSQDYSGLKALPSQSPNNHYLPSPGAYPLANMASYGRQPMADRRPSAPLPGQPHHSPAQSQQSPLLNSTTEVTAALSSLDVGQRHAGAWVDPTDTRAATAVVPEAVPQLPPLSDTLHRIFPGQTTAGTPAHGIPPTTGLNTQPTATMVTMDQTAPLTTATPYYPQPVPFVDVPGTAAAAAGVVYQSQDPYLNDPSKLPPPPMTHDGSQVRHPSPAQMMPVNAGVNVPGAAAAGGYPRRVTYPFVPSIDTSSGLVMGNLISPASSSSSPLINGNPFTHGGGLVGVNAAGVVRSANGLYMDASMAIPPHQVPVTASHLGQPQALASQPLPGQQVWPGHEGAELPKTGEASASGKGYPFVSLSGVTTTKKRPRRRFDEIERLYVCNWGDCEKSYGTLNHLNAHVTMQKHGPKRHPSEFKELRKAWRRHKKAEEEAAKQAAALQQQQQQQQQQQLQMQQQLCEPTVAGFHQHPMQPMHHQFAHPQQPPQLPMPPPHPNQYQPHPHPQTQHHPMGY